MSEQYRICPECGSSLDPEEKCDCMTIIQEVYVVSFALSGNDDSVALILKREGDKHDIRGHITGKDAEELYEKLANNKNNKLIIKETT